MADVITRPARRHRIGSEKTKDDIGFLHFKDAAEISNLIYTIGVRYRDESSTAMQCPRGTSR